MKFLIYYQKNIKFSNKKHNWIYVLIKECIIRHIFYLFFEDYAIFIKFRKCEMYVHSYKDYNLKVYEYVQPKLLECLLTCIIE